MGKMRCLVCWVAVFIAWTLTVTAQLDNRKMVGGAECLVRQYCSQEDAVKALVKEFDFSVENATEFVQNSNGNSKLKSCSCHDSCVYLNTCCQDKTDTVPERLQAVKTRLTSDSSSYECQKTLGVDLIVVPTCPEDSNNVIKTLCETVLMNEKERQMELKATSKLSGLTYKNIYCAMCNGEKTQDLETWVWNFDCKALNIKGNSSEGDGPKSLIQIYGDQNCDINTTLPSVPPPSLDGPIGLHQRISVYADSLNFCTSPPIADCPRGTESALAARCTDGNNAFVIVEEKVYKNRDCLVCNEGPASIDSALCEGCELENCEHPDTYFNPNNLLSSFGILVGSYHGSARTCKSENAAACDTITPNIETCGNGKFLNYKTSQCETICPTSSYFQEGECKFTGLSSTCEQYSSYSDFTSAKVSQNHKHILEGRTFKVLGDGEPKCYNCSYLVKSHEVSSVQVINDKVFYNGERINPNMLYPINSTNGSYWVCLDQTHLIEEIITIVLLGISIVALVVYFLAFIIMKRLRNVPGKIVAANMLCLLIAYVLFLLRPVAGEYTPACTIFGVLIHYFLLSSFMFNIIYASFIVHSLEFIDFESSVNHWTAIRMWILGLLAPFVIIIPALIVDTITLSPHRPEYGGKECFIMNHYGRLIFFIGPIGLCLLVAVILYLVILIKLVQIAKATSQVRSNHKEKVAIAMKLVVVLGFNWIFAVLAAATEHPVVTMIFIATCTLQGFFGFVVFICNKATLKDIRKFCVKKGALKLEMTSSASKNISTTGTASTDLTKGLLNRNSNSLSLRP